jgi:hypothetical protein
MLLVDLLEHSFEVIEVDCLVSRRREETFSFF